MILLNLTKQAGQAKSEEITEFLLFFSVYSVRDLMARVRITPKKCNLSNEGCWKFLHGI